ncbi:unnamed protein product [Chrysoparadoxa australica]
MCPGFKPPTAALESRERTAEETAAHLLELQVYCRVRSTELSLLARKHEHLTLVNEGLRAELILLEDNHQAERQALTSRMDKILAGKRRLERELRCRADDIALSQLTDSLEQQIASGSRRGSSSSQQLQREEYSGFSREMEMREEERMHGEEEGFDPSQADLEHPCDMGACPSTGYQLQVREEGESAGDDISDGPTERERGEQEEGEASRAMISYHQVKEEGEVQELGLSEFIELGRLEGESSGMPTPSLSPSGTSMVCLPMESCDSSLSMRPLPLLPSAAAAGSILTTEQLASDQISEVTMMTLEQEEQNAEYEEADDEQQDFLGLESEREWWVEDEQADAYHLMSHRHQHHHRHNYDLHDEEEGEEEMSYACSRSEEEGLADEREGSQQDFPSQLLADPLEGLPAELLESEGASLWLDRVIALSSMVVASERRRADMARQLLYQREQQNVHISEMSAEMKVLAGTVKSLAVNGPKSMAANTPKSSEGKPKPQPHEASPVKPGVGFGTAVFTPARKVGSGSSGEVMQTPMSAATPVTQWSAAECLLQVS